MEKNNIARVIDQTFLKREAKREEVEKIAEEAKEYGFRGFCVLPCHTAMAKEVLKDSQVKVTTLIDEPTGASFYQERMEMAKKAKKDGSDELELVMKIDYFKNNRYQEVMDDLKVICSILPTKVIIGSGYLTDEEIRKASEIVKESGAISVKTATVDDPLGNSELEEKAKHIKIMKEVVGDDILVKASGAIRTLADAEMMLEAGADIIGTSSGVEIVKGAEGKNIELSEEWRKAE
jgi:deoxyribose-phosphate aldolase